MAYATIDALALVMGEPIGETERERAQKLLDMAAAYIDGHCEPSKVSADVLEMVSITLVQRVYDKGRVGLSQSTVSGGPYSQTYTYASSSGSFWLTKDEKRMLGIRRYAAGCVKVEIHDADGNPVEW